MKERITLGNILRRNKMKEINIEELKEEKQLLEHFHKLAQKIEKNAKGEKLLTALP